MTTRISKRTIVQAAWAMLGISAVASTALPLAQVWERQRAEATAEAFGGTAGGVTTRADQPAQIVVDVKDDASPADIAEVQRRVGATLAFNSPKSQNDKVMVATLPNAQAANDALARLQGDANVEAAEPEMTYSLPEQSPEHSDVMRAVAMVQAQRTDISAAKQEAVEAEWQGRKDSANAAGIYCSEGVGQAEPDSHRASGVYDVHMDDAMFHVNSSGQWMFEAVPPAMSMPYINPLKPGTGTRPNDPMYDQQWNFKMIGAEDAWKKTKGKGVIVAVIDTGVAAADSPKGKRGKDFNTTSFVPGYDFVGRTTDAYDDHGHGTHVAGTIAESTNNNEGVAGLAYEATIMPLKVLGANGSGNSADIADAIRYAADNGATVINMSLGSNRPSSVIHNACKYAAKKGVIIVCAAGNGFGEPVGYPAAFPECVAVSSVGPSGNIAKYSSYGKEVALAAPGGDMMDSGDPKDGILQNTVLAEGRGGRSGDDYYAFQGTSMASPHIAAVAALIESAGVKDPAKVRDILLKTATPNGDPNKFGAGIVSAGGAVNMAAAENGFKLRHLLLLGGAAALLLIGGSRKRFGVRLAMAGALGLGFFGADFASDLWGANSPLNLLTFSAAIPLAAFLALRRTVGGAKVAGALALGAAVNLWAGWHNGIHPFMGAEFGDAATGWTLANMTAAFGIAVAAGRIAVRKASAPVKASGL